MADDAPPAELLEQILRAQLTAATSLTDILHRENVAIRERDGLLLTDLGSEKLAALQNLESLEQKRKLHVDSTSATTLAKSLTSNSSKLWDQVIAALKVCDQRNKLNGVMLQLRQEQVQRALDLISDRDTNSVTYAPDGSTKSGKGTVHTWASV